MSPPVPTNFVSRLRFHGSAAPPVILSALLFACGTGGHGTSGGAPPAAEPASIAGAGGRFVGSVSCRDCHTPEFGAWAASRHRSTLRPWAAGQPIPLASAPLPAGYRVDPDGSAVGPGPDGKPVHARAAFFLGGRHREDLLVKMGDGRVQVFPVAMDVDAGEPFEPIRALAGGTPPPADVVDFWTRAGRNADLACYGCHATGQVLDVAGVSPGGLALPASRWAEPGVGCEGCHGPGGAHVEAARAGKPSRVSILLGPQAGAASVTDACAACHGLRDVLPSPFSRTPAHRYGEPIVSAADPLLAVPSNFEFRDPIFSDLRPGTYQQEAIAFLQSGCARGGGLSCRTCHDSHSGALTEAVAGADGGDAICAPCHAAIFAAGERHRLHAPGTRGGRCLDCHMPAVLRGPGRSPARDHTMSPPVAGPGQIAEACVGCHAGAKNAGAVAAAWSRIVPGAAAKRRRALGEAMEGALEGRYEAAVALAGIASDERAYSWFVRWAAILRLGQTEKSPSAKPLLDPVRRTLDDSNPALRRAAIRALGRMGTKDDIASLRRATDDADPWAALEAAAAMGALGSSSALARLRQLLERPDLVSDARAQSLYGHARLAAGDGRDAESALRRALEIHPMVVGTINDLGLALLAQGKRDEAIAAWRRALDINPRYAAARDNLQAIEPRNAR
jgi:predicted CXXCH cytochrome family protein